MNLPALTCTLGGSKAKVLAPGSPYWLASPSPAGRNILNSVKNNKHGLININRPTRCQKGKREDCFLAGASLDQEAAASPLIIWRQAAGSPSPAPGPGQAEARPWGSKSLSPQLQDGYGWPPCPLCQGLSLDSGLCRHPARKLQWLPAAHQTEPACPSHSGLKLPPQPCGSPVHRLQPWRVSGIFQKCQALIPQIFPQTIPFWGKALLPWKNATLIPSLYTRAL